MPSSVVGCWPAMQTTALPVSAGEAEAGDGVGQPAAGGDAAHPDAAGGARVGVGGIRACLLMAHVDQLDAVLAQRAEDRKRVAAVDREQVAHAELAQDAADDGAAVDQRGRSRAALAVAATSPNPCPETSRPPVRRASGAGVGSRLARRGDETHKNVSKLPFAKCNRAATIPRAMPADADHRWSASAHQLPRTRGIASARWRRVFRRRDRRHHGAHRDLCVDRSGPQSPIRGQVVTYCARAAGAADRRWCWHADRSARTSRASRSAPTSPSPPCSPGGCMIPTTTVSGTALFLVAQAAGDALLFPWHPLLPVRVGGHHLLSTTPRSWLSGRSLTDEPPVRRPDHRGGRSRLRRRDARRPHPPRALAAERRPRGLRAAHARPARCASASSWRSRARSRVLTDLHDRARSREQPAPRRRSRCDFSNTFWSTSARQRDHGRGHQASRARDCERRSSPSRTPLDTPVIARVLAGRAVVINDPDRAGLVRPRPSSARRRPARGARRRSPPRGASSAC